MSNPDSRKRPRPDSAGPMVRPVSDADKILELIRSRGNMGIWQADINRETSMPQTLITKQIKNLLSKNLIKEVKDIRHKLKKKILMAVEFEPAEEMTGGSWYLDGALNTERIASIKTKCLEQITKLKISTVEMIHKEIKKSDPNSVFDLKQIGDIVEALKLDREVEELKSTGKGDFVNIPNGRVCYRKFQRRGGSQLVGGLASVPCGVCPRLRDCTPDGLISPYSCVYFNEFLKWEF